MIQQINNLIKLIFPESIFRKSFTIYFLCLIFLFSINKAALAKNLSNKNFLCADEIGPKIEFLIPNFEKDSKKKKFSYKIFDEINRKSFERDSSYIIKKQSPIDYSYDYYTAKILNQNKNQSITFEFFPPSTMMFKTGENPFKTLACWEN
tara:strand:- start:921 stop:1370 length:450 start_codon:yes stop_codon:yes gene_type:complete